MYSRPVCSVTITRQDISSIDGIGRHNGAKDGKCVVELLEIHHHLIPKTRLRKKRRTKSALGERIHVANEAQGQMNHATGRAKHGTSHGVKSERGRQNTRQNMGDTKDVGITRRCYVAPKGRSVLTEEGACSLESRGRAVVDRSEPSLVAA